MGSTGLHPSSPQERGKNRKTTGQDASPSRDRDRHRHTLLNWLRVSNHHMRAFGLGGNWSTWRKVTSKVDQDRSTCFFFSFCHSTRALSKQEQLCSAVLQSVCRTDRIIAWVSCRLYLRFNIEQVAVQTVLPNTRLTQAGWCEKMNHETVLISKQSDTTDMTASQVAEFFH